MTIGFLSFIVWAHHMYLTGMGTQHSAPFFQTTTMMISIPSVIILYRALSSRLWGASIRVSTPMLFAHGLHLRMFGVGGLTGFAARLQRQRYSFLHDFSMYVPAHYHYIVAPGTIFALCAQVLLPSCSSVHVNEFWGKVHFWFFLYLHEFGLHAHVHSGHGRHVAPDV